MMRRCAAFVELQARPLAVSKLDFITEGGTRMLVSRRATLAMIGAAGSIPFFSRASAAELVPLRVGIIAIESSCLAFYAKENGFFQNAGLDVTIAMSPSSPAVAAAVVSGTHDIAFSGISTLAAAHAKGLPFVLVAPCGMIGPGVVSGGITVAAQSTIRTAKDLNGKTFAASGLNTQSEYGPRAWIDKHGGDSTTCKFVEIPFPQVADAIASARVDAGYLVEPFLNAALKRNLVRDLASGDDAVGTTFLASGWYALAAWAKAHPDTITAFATAIGQAAHWANANPAKVVPIIAEHLKLDPAVIAGVPRTLYTDRLVAAQVQPWIDVTAKYAKFSPFPSTELIYNR
jgi:NitT/TauT family transport system substrate-binding protein